MSTWRQPRTVALLTLAVLLGHALILHLMAAWEPEDAPELKTLVLMPLPAVPAPAAPPQAAPARSAQRPRPPAVPVAPVSAQSAAPAEVAVPEALAAPAADVMPASGTPSETALAQPRVSDGTAADETPPAQAPTKPAARYQVPGSLRMRFAVAGVSRGFNYTASGELLWQHDGQQYSARYEVSAFLVGARSQTSVGQLGTTGLMPRRFGDKSRSELAAHFERDKGIISYSANTPSTPLLEGAQDRLSVLIQMGAQLAAMPELHTAGARISVPVTSAREAETWTFQVEGEETVDVPAGSLRTLKITRSPRREFDQKIEVWLAPSHGYLPVRFKLTQSNGDFVDQLLRSVSAP